jgi:4-hydroxy-tetrahydrodipicolinate reductase
MLKITVSGSRGRMGRMIKRLIESDPGLELSGEFDIDDEPESQIKVCDVMIDFTTPEATLKNLKTAERLGKSVVIGTTGLDDKGRAAIKKASSRIPIVFSPNMAVGVNLLFDIVRRAASMLDGSYKVSISETHHAHKKDAPSGTAKKLLDIIARARESDKKDIKVESHRTGEVVGDHAVIFDGAEETLELRHHAKSRGVFAGGAIIAARFIAGKKKGLYGMDQVLGMKG